MTMQPDHPEYAAAAGEIWGEFSLIGEPGAQALLFAPTKERGFWIASTCGFSRTASPAQQSRPGSERCEFIMKIADVVDPEDELHKIQLFYALGALLKVASIFRENALACAEDVLILPQAEKLNPRLGAAFIRPFSAHSGGETPRILKEVRLMELVPLISSETSIVRHSALRSRIPSAYNPFRTPLDLSDYWGFFIPRKVQKAVVEASSDAELLAALTDEAAYSALLYAWGYSRRLLKEHAVRSLESIVRVSPELASRPGSAVPFVPSRTAAAAGGLILPFFADLVQVFLKPNIAKERGARRIDKAAESAKSKLMTDRILCDDPDFQDAFFDVLDEELKKFFEIASAANEKLKKAE